MPDKRLTRTFLTLGILCTSIYLWGAIAHVISIFSHLLLLLSAAWLIAFVLKPVAHWMDQGMIPQALVAGTRRRRGDRLADLLGAIRIPYSVAAVLLYLLMLLGLVTTILLVVPGLINQLLQLAENLPQYVELFPDWWAGVQDEAVQRFGVDRETLADLIPMEDFVNEAQSVLPDVIQRIIEVVQGIVSGVANTLLVLIFSLYIMLDGKRLSDQVDRVLPLRYHDDLDFINRTVVRTFGSFLRGKVVQGAIHAVFVGVVMALWGLQYTVVTALFTGLLMFIPQLGAPVAMLAPPVASMIQGSDATIPLLFVMILFQQALIRLIMPNLTSESIGMPPLLMMISVIIGAQLVGVWGFFFSTPVAAAIYIVATSTLERMKQTFDVQDEELEGLLRPAVE